MGTELNTETGEHSGASPCSHDFPDQLLDFRAICDQRDTLLCRVAEAEDEASALRAAIFRALEESDYRKTGMVNAFHLLRAVGNSANEQSHRSLPGASVETKSNL
jgi:hypothetical protein